MLVSFDVGGLHVNTSLVAVDVLLIDSLAIGFVANQQTIRCHRFRGRCPTTSLHKDQACLELRVALLEHLAYLFASNHLATFIQAPKD